MEMNKAAKYSARVSDKYFLSDNNRFLYVKFELVEPNELNFFAGQYVSLKVDAQGTRRCYSIASTPDNTHGFHLMAEIVPNGKGSEFLQKVEIGEVVEVMAPMGKFVVVPQNSQKKLLFVATGSGIVPIWSMINDLLINKNWLGAIRLNWGMKSEDDLFWLDNLTRLEEAHPNFVFDVVLSKPGEEWELCSGHVQDCLKRDFPNGLGEWEAYVCGSPEIVIDICQQLEQMGINKEYIHHEKFA